MDLFESLFHQDSVSNILDIFWCDAGASDKMVWLQEKSGKFSVRSVYHLIYPLDISDSRWWTYL